jgi:tetratricopeptide (TPR) repeat protein
MAISYHQLGITAQARGLLDEADDWCRKSLAIKEELGNRSGMATDYHHLGLTAYLRRQLDEAEDWFRKSLTVFEETGNRPNMALNYMQLGVLAEERGQPLLALEWNIRCVTLFEEFPSPMADAGPAAVARLTRQLGIPALEQAWQQVTGLPVNQVVLDYVSSHHDENPLGS